MQNDDLMFVGHMVDMARTTQRLVAGASREDLDKEEKFFCLRILSVHRQVAGCPER